jgi:hypothetical protein
MTFLRAKCCGARESTLFKRTAAKDFCLNISSSTFFSSKMSLLICVFQRIHAKVKGGGGEVKMLSELHAEILQALQILYLSGFIFL